VVAAGVVVAVVAAAAAAVKRKQLPPVDTFTWQWLALDFNRVELSGMCGEPRG
jgi:hypothetical protein